MTEALYTVGHSNHTADRLVALLKMHEVHQVADVRSSPYSRFNPQFNREALAAQLHTAGIQYLFLGQELGARPADRGCYWGDRVAYDLLAASDEFRRGLHRLTIAVHNHRVAVLCAEKDPITCHRGIVIARHILCRGVAVRHILETGELETHESSLSRLLRELKLPEADLFRTREEIVEEAYRLRGERIAYAEAEQPAPAGGTS